MKKHTDSGFTFDIQGDHAVVMEIDGNPAIVEIPGEIDGVPVTELAEYLIFRQKLPGDPHSFRRMEDRQIRLLQLPGAGRTVVFQ